MSRVHRLKLFAWAVVGLAVPVAVARFLFGLGATTHLSDAVPWGLWIGFDVLSGVALAAGGFVVTAAVYIFKLERLHSVVRPAVLTAFLGYVAVVVGLLFDLGLPWNIWHMIVFWNPHSPLFEVGWCVMLYLTVLVLEFLPVPAEQLKPLARVGRFLARVRLALVIAGIGLSTLHQSSLGSLFLIMPSRLHPLWYSPLLPVLFLVSAIGLGLAMAIFESHSTTYLYRRKPETEVLAGLGNAARFVLIGYVLLRLADLAARGTLSEAGKAQWQAGMFWLELALMAVIPAVLFSVRKLRQRRGWQWAAASICVLGTVLNRINVGGLVHQGRGAEAYLPSWNEWLISAGVVCAAVLVFLFFVERFRVWEERPVDPAAEPLRLPEFQPVGMTWLGWPVVAGRTAYSLAFVLAASLGVALIAPRAAEARGVPATAVHRARGGETLWIDGDRDGVGVEFPHAAIGKKLGGPGSCPLCHHMNLPRDRSSGCYECHRDMYLESDAFRHEFHASPSGAKLGCTQCHRKGQPRSKQSAVACAKCHKDLIPAGATIQVASYRAPGYVRAMHGLCIDCHLRHSEAAGKPRPTACTYCHRQPRSLAQGEAPGPKEVVGKALAAPFAVR